MHHMTEYTPAKTGEYPRIYPRYIPNFQLDVYSDKSFPLEFNSRWRSVLLLLQNMGQVYLFIKSYQRTLKSKNLTQQMITFRKRFSRVLQKYLKDTHHNSLHLTQKHARVLVLRIYLCLKVYSFRETLSESFSHIETDNVPAHTSVLISAPNGGYCLCIKIEV